MKYISYEKGLSGANAAKTGVVMNLRKAALLFIDILIILLISVGVTLLLSDINSIKIDISSMPLKLSLLALCLVGMRVVLRCYSCIWRYANVPSYVRLLVSDALGCGIYLIIGLIRIELYPGFAFSVISVMAIMIATLLTRFGYQIIYARNNRLKELHSIPEDRNKINIAIVGAGNVGVTLADELMRNSSAVYKPYCFIDNDRFKIGNEVRGLKILAQDDDIIERLKKMPVEEIIIAIPKASAETRADLYEFYKKTGCKVKLYDFVSNSDDEEESRRVIRDFEIEELLFRDSISLNPEGAANYYGGKTVLVTGGGGSIGSELCRQIAKCSPRHLVIVDVYENSTYDIQQELVRKYGDELKLSVIIASVRDAERIDKIFAEYKPEIVFHAAAHKHVPLMEDSPMEAIKNNVFGTYNVANAAEKHGVRKFILISTDKAVNPTNIMGASKRICEMTVQCRRDSRTEFAAVRFGNVLGSNGSVIPLFKRQILAGGPITLTDKRIIRYFMTIPEAVGLVMEAGMLAKGGELFVLDMGKPIKILSLAEKMISLMGFVPYKDIDIVEIGLRKGEKLYEELLIKTSELTRTENNMIFIERDKPLTREEMEEKLSLLEAAMGKNDAAAAIEAVKATVDTYRNPDELNKECESAEEMRIACETVAG